ncbi:MAG TPA: CBS domain-containing protein [Blastocatellia bacterium]|jgi:CBS domain-containing protein|nr:CBS domain-containing protein [Blastocatellia bacterium]
MSIERAFTECKIYELKVPAPVCIEPTASLANAIESMRAGRSACVLVCEDKRPIGILTERDILNKVAGENVALDTPVRDFITPNPQTLNADQSLGDAIQMMDHGDYRHVPVVDNSGRVEGIISIEDIIEFLAQSFPTEVLNIPPRQDQYMSSREGG